MPAIRVTMHDDFDQLRPWRGVWNALAEGLPFLEWAWLETWWKHYGRDADRPRPNHQLLLLAVWDGDTLIGAAPWYLHCTITDGRVIRFLGSGEACGDYLTLLSAVNRTWEVTAALAEWLTAAACGGREIPAWDLIELSGVLAGDLPLCGLAAHLLDNGQWVETTPLMSGWRIALADDWDSFLERFSKSHRKQIRRAERALRPGGEYSVRRVSRAEELPRGWQTLVDLHTQRWRSFGQKGCFHSLRFREFHRELLGQFFAAGRLELFWIEHAGKPISAEYQFLGSAGTYAYQSGVHPECLNHEPGRLATVAGLQNALARGDAYYDLLRGDEPYKAHWRADPRELVSLRIVPNRAFAKWRFRLQTAGSSMKQWLKQGWHEWIMSAGGSSIMAHI